MQPRQITLFLIGFLLLTFDAPLWGVHVLALLGVGLSYRGAMQPGQPFRNARLSLIALAAVWIALSIVSAMDIYGTPRFVLWRFLLPATGIAAGLTLAYAIRSHDEVSDHLGAWLWWSAVAGAATSLGVALNYELLARRGVADVWWLFAITGLVAIVAYVGSLLRIRASLHSSPLPDI